MSTVTLLPLATNRRTYTINKIHHLDGMIEFVLGRVCVCVSVGGRRGGRYGDLMVDFLHHVR